MRFGITLHLSWVGFAEADDPDAVECLRKAKNMDTVSKQAQCDIPRLWELLSIVNGEDGSTT
jgi:hypothetical protein